MKILDEDKEFDIEYIEDLDEDCEDTELIMDKMKKI